MASLDAIRARRSAKRAELVTPNRSCAGCDVCCSAPGIRELGKPPGVACHHLAGEAGRSCSVYASRPFVCVDFYCLWRSTDRVLPDWLKPSECGFMLAFNNPSVFPTVVTVHVDPARPDATNNPWAETVFATLAEHWNCLVAIGQVPITSRIYCPNGQTIEVAKSPAAMNIERGTVGAPAYVFGPDRRPLRERLGEVVFDWADMPLPPWAPERP